MTFSIGMRIPPNLGAQGIQSVATWAAGTGFDVLDVPELNETVREACKNTNLQIGSVDAASTSQLLSREATRRENALGELKAQMTEMARLGGRVLFMCLVPEDPTLPRHEGFAIWKDVFPEVVRHAEKEDIYIALEGWPGPGPYYPTLGCTPEMWRAMFEVIPSKHLGLNYDPSHLVRLGIDYLRVLTEFGDRVNHCHGKDTEILYDEQYECGNLPATFGAKYAFSEGSWRYTIPGHGEVDWGRVAIRLDGVGYQGPISVELEDHRFWGSLELEQQGLTKALEHLIRYFK